MKKFIFWPNPAHKTSPKWILEFLDFCPIPEFRKIGIRSWISRQVWTGNGAGVCLRHLWRVTEILVVFVLVHNTWELSLDSNQVHCNWPQNSSKITKFGKLEHKLFFFKSLMMSSKVAFFWIAILFLYIKSLHNSHT